MDDPTHEQVSLGPTERAEFLTIARRFEFDQGDELSGFDVGRRIRIRMLVFSHRLVAALLLPLGLAALAGALLIWWPLGLLAAGLVLAGLLTTFELARARLLRRRLHAFSHNRKT